MIIELVHHYLNILIITRLTTTAGFENEFQKSDQSLFDQYLIIFNDSFLQFCKPHHITCTFLNLTTTN